METKKQKQEKLKEACRKINVEAVFRKRNEVTLYHKTFPVAVFYCYYAGNKIIRLYASARNQLNQQKYNQIFNIIQQINEDKI